MVAQRKRIYLPMQETQVKSLVRDDPTCCEATKSEPQLLSLCSRDGAATTEAHAPYSPCSMTRDATTVRHPCTAPRVGPATHNQNKVSFTNKDPTQPEINKN